MFTAGLFIIAKLWKYRCSSTDEWIKMWQVHTCAYIHAHTLEYYSAVKKNTLLPFAVTWGNFEGIMISEMSEKGKYCMI